jgi:hypothetical protein
LLLYVQTRKSELVKRMGKLTAEAHQKFSLYKEGIVSLEKLVPSVPSVKL